MDRINLYLGFIGNRLRRLFRKPDIDWVTRMVAIGGYTDIGDLDLYVIDVRHLTESGYPDINKINWLTDEINEISKDIRVFVHCRVGRGRAPLVVACWLMRYKRYSLQRAIDIVKKARPYVYFTKNQREFLKDYYWKMVT